MGSFTPKLLVHYYTHHIITPIGQDMPTGVMMFFLCFYITKFKYHLCYYLNLFAILAKGTVRQKSKAHCNNAFALTGRDCSDT